MSWTYTADPTHVLKDQVRLLIGDTDELDPLLQDEEIAFLLTSHDNPKKAASEACLLLYARFIRQVNYAIGPESVQAGERAKGFKALAEVLASAVAAGGAPSSGNSSNALFDIGMHDNRKYGRGGLRG